MKPLKEGPRIDIFYILIGLFFFVVNAINFINEKGSDIPILSALFNMSLALCVIILLIHKKDIKKEKKYYQEKLDKYFKKEN